MFELPPVPEKDQTVRNALGVFYWNHVALEMNRLTHSVGGPQGGPPMSARALGLVHLAMHDAFFAALEPALLPDPAWTPWLAPGAIADASSTTGLAALAASLETAEAALDGAAAGMLGRLYRVSGSYAASEVMVQALNRHVAARPRRDALAPAFRFGDAIAALVFDARAVKPGDKAISQDDYEPRTGAYYFRDEPGHPVRLVDNDPNDPGRGAHAGRVFHGPFYGTLAPSIGVSSDAAHTIAPPPVDFSIAPSGDTGTYRSALLEVKALGAKASTTRTGDQTAAALFWAYDGANLIGTPPRLYNQILRDVSWSKSVPSGTMPTDAGTVASLVRLFALCNVAMADAGKFAWKEKYRFELWRPLTGIREHDAGCGADAVVGADNLGVDGNPFWQALGAPETNRNLSSFKPPFPAYPSGHATFGAACFQMIRLFYGAAGSDRQSPDTLGFTQVSDELNGVSRDLYQPYDPARPLTEQPGLVRTRVVRRFGSLWRAIRENALSRIWLGVHWNFDAYDPADEGTDPATIRYGHVRRFDGSPEDPELPTGGVPLGMGIANDIFAHGLHQAGSVPTSTPSTPSPGGSGGAGEGAGDRGRVAHVRR